MPQDLGSAAATLVYYIKLVAAKADLKLSTDSHAELNAAIEAFNEAGKRPLRCRDPLCKIAGDHPLHD